MAIKTGPTLFAGPLAWGLLGLAAILAIASAAVAIGLARFDGRADGATLASVGARGITRRSIAFWQALMICSLGSLLGSALGILPAFALGSPGGVYPFTPPWMQIALAAIALPIAISLGSWMLATRPLRAVRRTGILADPRHFIRPEVVESLEGGEAGQLVTEPPCRCPEKHCSRLTTRGPVQMFWSGPLVGVSPWASGALTIVRGLSLWRG